EVGPIWAAEVCKRGRYAAMLDAGAISFSQWPVDQVAVRCNDKIGAETRKRLKQAAGIVIDDYLIGWRNRRAPELLEEAAKWEDGRYWRDDFIWEDTKHLDKAAYGAAMAAKLRWQAAHELAGERITREEEYIQYMEGTPADLDTEHGADDGESDFA